ncbi:hypothetical protein BDM02DRAFT_3171887 [Thelephora ganbajun]|uniref:Uncharacterized protein n=1 Tax=Thelephora ganbajun TaxID=370292 RepID=A0ACB6Z9Y1_THEGA|nr:hypothetical protein BDM02DRAFT_3171887 [Thelephora ganbajun]
MVKYWEHLQPEHIAWIVAQKLFWVATSPLSPDGHINVSPKGVAGTFHVINEHKVWYEDLTGSGIETISHIRENGRITVMFSAFEGAPRIVRLFGKGTVYEFGSKEYTELIPPEKRNPGSRAVIMVDIYQVSSSCGYAVPFYSYQGERHALNQFFNNKEQKDNEAEADAEDPSMCKAESGIKEYWENKNAKSLDGLPGLFSASSVGFRPNGYNVNIWTKSSPASEKQANEVTQTTRYVDAKFLAVVATGGLFATACYAIFQHAQLQFSLLRS